MMEFITMLWKDLDIATTILLLLLMMGAWVMWTVQHNHSNNFKFEDMLRDDAGKPSAFRLAIFVSLAVSTWIMMYIVLQTKTIDTWMYITYLAVWSGAKIAETALLSYTGSRGITPAAPTQPQSQPDQADVRDQILNGESK